MSAAPFNGPPVRCNAPRRGFAVWMRKTATNQPMSRKSRRSAATRLASERALLAKAKLIGAVAKLVRAVAHLTAAIAALLLAVGHVG